MFLISALGPAVVGGAVLLRPTSPTPSCPAVALHVDESGLTYEVNGGEIVFTGLEFGGSVAAFGKWFG
ncbi:hypothetical protein MSAR_22850 [Mycolicibacterium sarraceniae]|uniref:Uncharacterized protein n=1 Tax=Mycolicibacterium sarraceniae TaxID=1534348 RepID=A0A7I7SSM8_9MYCO|nr:hypothetical protein MSAR_22850 [Mycolicibacterium sarraceniae]